MFHERLTSLREVVPGAQAVCLAASDGIAVEMTASDSVDVEVLAAEMVAMAQGIASEQRALGVGMTDRLEVATEVYSVILQRLREDYYLLLVVDAGVPVGRARFELRRAAPAFEEDLV